MQEWGCRKSNARKYQLKNLRQISKIARNTENVWDLVFQYFQDRRKKTIRIVVSKNFRNNSRRQISVIFRSTENVGDFVSHMNPLTSSWIPIQFDSWMFFSSSFLSFEFQFSIAHGPALSEARCPWGRKTLFSASSISRCRGSMSSFATTALDSNIDSCSVVNTCFYSDCCIMAHLLKHLHT